MADKLIVKGLGRLDGEYEFDFAGMLGIGTPDSLTNREGHRIKTMSGVRAGELEDALIAGDNDVLVAFAAIILARAGKTVNEEQLWDAPMGSGVQFDLETREAEEEDDADSPPPETGEDETDTSDGGTSSESTSAQKGNGQSPIGLPGSLMSVTSGQTTSVR